MPNHLTRRQFISKSVQSLSVLPLSQRFRNGNNVLWVWSGAMQPTSVRIKAKLLTEGKEIRLLVSTALDLSNPLIFAPESISERLVVDFSAENLTPDTRYYYGIRIDGTIDPEQGRTHTSKDGSYAFTFGFASCARTDSQSGVFNSINAADPLFFMQLGDMHYENIGINDPTLYHNAYDGVLASSRQRALYSQMPIGYMWDDHDYGPNNSDASSPSRPAARATYQEVVPHYPLAFGSGQIPINYAFTVGRVRFIVTDTRSERDEPSYTDPTRSMFDPAQKDWLKQELLKARDSHVATFWAGTSPWIADPPGAQPDNWSGYKFEREELSNFIIKNRINNLFYISGDVHMLAADDGTNNRYSTSGLRGFPVFQAAAMDQSGSSFSNNTYSAGQFPREHQYALVHVHDNGGRTIGIEYVGIHTYHGEQLRLSLASPYQFDWFDHQVSLPIVMNE